MIKIKNLISIVLLIFGICLIFPNIAFALDYENGHFEKVQTNLEVTGCPLKLKDGRILILDNNRNYIFNPKNNTFRETTPTPFGFSYVSNGGMFPAVVLNNGKVFIIGKILEPPFDKFKDELYEPIKAIFTRDELRNNPKFASDMEESDDELEQEWDNCAENHEYGIEIAKFNINALELFDQYHKDEIVERGSEAVAFTIKESYVEDFYKLLEAIQEQLLKEIESKRISIECNPTSNYKIGEMSNYDEHPILKFYNSGLNTPYNKHDIAVSINTDDQGVFSTSLEREYSLIALAIERHQTEGFKNSPRQIIDWLDKIRQMSVEQQFDNDIFNYKKN